MNAYEYGVTRGRATGRDRATDRDWEWLADETGGAVQGTDPQDAVDFEAGMRAGASEPDNT